MAVKIPDEGQLALLKAITSGSAPSIQFRLFQNNVTVTNTTVWANLTEATFTGYLASTTTWGALFTNGSDQAESDGSAVVFTKGLGGTSNTIYGWAATVTDISGTKVIACDNITPAKSMSANGDGISLTPTPRLYRE